MLPFLFTSILALVIGAAIPALAAPLSGGGSHNQTALRSFIGCLGNTTDLYKFTIEGNAIVVMPIENRTIRDDPADDRLWSCIFAHTAWLNIITSDNVYEDEATAQAINHNQLLRLGAVGLILPFTRLTKAATAVADKVDDAHALDARQVWSGWYQSFPSSDKACVDNDQQSHVGEACYNWSQAYESIQFFNNDAFASLTVWIYPHHWCGSNYFNTNARAVPAGPQQYSSCATKTTFSWRGRFSNPSLILPCSYFASCF